MKFSEEQLQELKENKIQFKDLDDRYFISAQEEIKDDYIENILELLNNDICNFKEIIDKLKSIKDKDNDPCLYELLRNKEFFKELIENNKLTKDDLSYLLNTIDEWYELYPLSSDTHLLTYMIDNDLFQELIDKFKNIEDEDGGPCLYRLLAITLLRDTTQLLPYLIENNKLTKDDLEYLLSKIDKIDELRNLCCHNTPLLKHTLNEFILDKETVDRFNALIENDDWYKKFDVHNIFDLIEFHATQYCNFGHWHRVDEEKIDQELLKLNEMNKYTYIVDFNENQKLELYEILRNSEKARGNLNQIVDNNLQDTYDFEQLKNLLNKDSEKKKIKFNL